MRVPNPKPMPLTLRDQVLRESRMLARLHDRLQTMALTRPPRDPDRVKDGDQPCPTTVPRASGLAQMLASVAQQGFDIAKTLPSDGDPKRRPSEVSFFFDLAFAAKLEFFDLMKESDDLYPI